MGVGSHRGTIPNITGVFPAGAPTILITLRDLFEGAGELQFQARYAGNVGVVLPYNSKLEAGVKWDVSGKPLRYNSGFFVFEVHGGR